MGRLIFTPEATHRLVSPRQTVFKLLAFRESDYFTERL